MSEITIKAHKGNRAKNLKSIADTIEEMLDSSINKFYGNYYSLTGKQGNTIKGYMEQLRIIAEEIK